MSTDHEWHVWRADEDGAVQWWVVAPSEVEARAFLATMDIPSEDTEHMAVEQVPDDAPFTLTDVDGVTEPDDPQPEGVEVGANPQGWPTYRARAGAWAALAQGKPYYLAGTEW